MFSEEQLIKKVVEGNRLAISQLLERYESYIYTICFTVLRTKAEAEEATQDTFMKIIRALPKYEKQGKLTTWMYSVAYRTALDYLKKRKNTSDLNGYDIGTAPAVEGVIESNEKSATLAQLIDHLPYEDRRLIRMYYLEEMSVKELSDIVGLTESNVKVKLYRARKSLAEYARKNRLYSELINS